jgi:hypothetical protein
MIIDMLFLEKQIEDDEDLQQHESRRKA